MGLKLAIFTQNRANFCKNMYNSNTGLSEKGYFFAENWQKIVIIILAPDQTIHIRKVSTIHNSST
jgi:uncharacterized membrane protein YiaA